MTKKLHQTGSIL